MPIEKQDAPAHIGPPRRGLEVFRDFGKRLVNAEEVVFEESIVFLSFFINGNFRLFDHLVQPRVRVMSERGLLQNEGEVVAECTFPGLYTMRLQMRLNLCKDRRHTSSRDGLG